VTSCAIGKRTGNQPGDRFRVRLHVAGGDALGIERLERQLGEADERRTGGCRLVEVVQPRAMFSALSGDACCCTSAIFISEF
jgi:hypothetical protein